MGRALLTAAVLLSVCAMPMQLAGQPPSGSPARTFAIDGRVIDASGSPVAAARVTLFRHNSTPQFDPMIATVLVAVADTDRDGRFSFGNLPLNTDLNYPFETQIWFDYAVARSGMTAPVRRIESSGTRSPSAVTSVFAEIRLR